MLLLNLPHPFGCQHHVVELTVELPTASLVIVPTLLPTLFLGVPDAVPIFLERDVVVPSDAPESHHGDFHRPLAFVRVVPADPRLRDFFQLPAMPDASAATIWNCVFTAFHFPPIFLMTSIQPAV